jgi:hypothetical protein
MPPSFRRALTVVLAALGVMAIAIGIFDIAADPHPGLDATPLLLALPPACAAIGAATMLHYIPDMKWHWTCVGIILLIFAGVARPVFLPVWDPLNRALMALILGPLFDYLAWRRRRRQARSADRSSLRARF